MLAFLVAAETFMVDRADQMKSKMNDRGATAVEYGLLVALIAAVIVAVVILLGKQINTAFTTVLTSIGGTAPSAS